jgi:putative ABC transport system permease protein
MVRDDKTLQPGQDMELKINDQKYHFTIVGVFMLPDSPMIVMNEKELAALSPDSDNVQSVRVTTVDHTGTYLNDTAKRLEQNMKKNGFNVAYTLTIDTIRSSSTGQFGFMIAFLLFMAGMVAVVGGLSLAGTMSLNVLERTREIGVMRSIGAGNGSIRSLVIIEGLIIGTLSWLIALPLSIPLGIGFCYAIGNAFFEKPLDFIFSVNGCLVWLAIVTVIATLASLAPASHASKLTIRETLSYE